MTLHGEASEASGRAAAATRASQASSRADGSRHRLVSAIVLVAATTAPAVAQTMVFETSTGHHLELPRADTVQCAQMEEIFARIDATEYRPIGPTPPSHPGDLALYDYEYQLSARWSEKCAARPRTDYFHGFGSMN